MKILAIGDVTSPRGVEHLEKNLWKIRKTYGIDFCIVNGENASLISSISKDAAESLLLSGADVITGGNHSLQNKPTYTFMDDNKSILRPLNFGDGAPGRGCGIFDGAGYRILVINAMGNVHIEPNLDSPFRYIEAALKENAGRYDFAVLDLHAEATGEKYAVAYEFDGRINAIFGTHTHVQTADEQILPCGTGYITDVGMCGESGGILGIDKDTIIYRMKNHLPSKFISASGVPVANGVIFDIESNGKCKSVTRISF